MTQSPFLLNEDDLQLNSLVDEDPEKNPVWGIDTINKFHKHEAEELQKQIISALKLKKTVFDIVSDPNSDPATKYNLIRDSMEESKA